MTDLIEQAVALVKAGDSCELRAYADPASPLSWALSQRGLLRAYMRGRAVIPADLRHLSGTPWTIGYGETRGVKEGDVWTLDQAETRLRARVAGYGPSERCRVHKRLSVQRR